jgi:small subunit ribosomal protein S20
MRQSRAAREHNRTQRSQLRSAVRQARSADGDTTAALANASSLLDRAGRKRLIHPNAAARQKSRRAKAAKKAGAER